jgi:mannonate dehydratase
MKLGVSHRRRDQLNDSHLRYLRQMGVEQVEVRISRNDADFARITEIKRIVESNGLELFEIMLNDLYSSPAFALDLPESKETLNEFKRFIENLGRAGIRNTTYAWCTGGLYKTADGLHRDCVTRDFHLEDVLRAPPAYFRQYTEEDMWRSYERFLAEMLPVAERCEVRLQLHPNDPPVTHQGVARIFSSTKAFERAMRMAGDNRYSAILFCVGTWAEMPGPDGKGEDIESALDSFVRAGRVHQVHFRNVSAPLPDFKETFIEDGYVDMLRIMQVLHDAGFEGMVVPDHVPRGVESDAGPYGTEAYLLGYLRAMMNYTGKSSRHD